MASLEEKILGERRENYCSSSEESEHEDSDAEEACSGVQKLEQAPEPPPVKEWNGTASNTGPKGVLKDWEQFKQYECQMRRDKELQRLAQIQKLALTCQSSEEARKEAEMEAELKELEDDGFLLEYQKEKMKQMYDRLVNGGQGERKVFGSLINITSSEQFLSEIDSEPRHITVIAHLSSPSLPACRALNSSLAELSRSHTNVKFVSVPLGCVGDHFSATFKTSGLPAMLAYRGGEVVGNFVRLGEELGEGYFVEDVEAFLVEAGLLRAGGLPGILRPTVDDDSD
ncbi:phosducin-like protein [Diaphorina citri]|uniref:Phosducin-like protein n=1 Tax=Diaphorina citri TaxID=121845 RepID=A0A1S3CU66_DIACI|nr:phosducin-like protein [Diaphorina citri]KAI5717962.1 hypothetical protein M8J77_014200 [Diaphorina citri]